jgi:hypothetical protein
MAMGSDRNAVSLIHCQAIILPFRLTNLFLTGYRNEARPVSVVIPEVQPIIREVDMSAKSLIMIVGAVVLAHIVIGCATTPKANAEEATLRITITATDDGEIKETVVGIKDGKEVPLTRESRSKNWGQILHSYTHREKEGPDLKERSGPTFPLTL